MRCFLRFKGELSVAAYQEADAPADCTLCYGILNTMNSLDTFLTKTKNCGYEFEDYRLNVTLPLSLVLRQEWMKTGCRTHGFTVDRFIDVKDAFK